MKLRSWLTLLCALLLSALWFTRVERRSGPTLMEEGVLADASAFSLSAASVPLRLDVAPSTAQRVERGVWTSVRVVDEQQRAIPSASLSTADASGTTDEHGEARMRFLAPPDSAYVPLVARAHGFVPCVKNVRLPCGEVVLELARPMALQGLAVGRDEQPLGRELVVFAWPFELGRNPPAAAILRFLRDGDEPGPEDAMRMARADRHGRFELGGIDPTVPHYLLAGCKGYLSDIVSVDPRDAHDLVLHVLHAYAAVLEYADESGQPLALSPTLALSRDLRYWSDAPGVETCALTAIGAVLAGMPAELERETPGGQITVFLAAESTPAIGPCTFHMKLPGYELVDLTLFPTALDNQVLQVRVVLSELAAGRGTLSLEPHGASASLAAAYRDALRYRPGVDAAVLHLENALTGEGSTIGTRVRLDGAMLLSDVPVGRYSYRLISLDKFVVLPPDDQPPGSVSVVAGQTTRVALDFADYGSLVVSLFDPERGAEYDGLARWTIADGVPRVLPQGGLELTRASPKTFTRGPYLVGLLRAGTYTLRGREPVWAEPADAQGCYVLRLEPQAVEHLRISLLPGG